MEDTPYPDQLLRGISTDQALDEYGFTYELFQFGCGDHKDWEEASINWRDNEEAVGVLLNMRKENGGPKYKNGIAVLDRSYLDSAPSKWKPLLSYERKALPDNPYHGNVLLKKGLRKLRRRMITAYLAEHAQALQV